MNFEWNDSMMQACQECFNNLAPEERIFKNHYELAKETEIDDSTIWKAFLLDKRVADWMEQEIELFTAAQMRKLIKDSGKNDRSVGAAQMINALNKTKDTGSNKEGDIFIYTYVPLNRKEQQAPNTARADRDLFEVGGD